MHVSGARKKSCGKFPNFGQFVSRGENSLTVPLKAVILTTEWIDLPVSKDQARVDSCLTMPAFNRPFAPAWRSLNVHLLR